MGDVDGVGTHLDAIAFLHRLVGQGDIVDGGATATTAIVDAKLTVVNL